MLNLTPGQIAGLITEYFYAQSAKCIKTFFVIAPIREYILRNLDDTQTSWLSQQITVDPGSIGGFLNSTAGKEAMKELFNKYYQHQQLKATSLAAPTEENK